MAKKAKLATSRSTKNTDSRGRVTLGEEYANRLVIVEKSENRIVLRLAEAVPAHEAWLHNNPTALASVQRGLEQARERHFSKGPDLSKAAKLAETLSDT